MAWSIVQQLRQRAQMSKEVNFSLLWKPSFFHSFPPSVLTLNASFLLLFYFSSGSLKVNFLLPSQYITLLCDNVLVSRVRVVCLLYNNNVGSSCPISFPLTDFIFCVSIPLTSSGHDASEIGRKGQAANSQSDSRYITQIYGDVQRYIPHTDARFLLGGIRSDQRDASCFQRCDKQPGMILFNMLNAKKSMWIYIVRRYIRHADCELGK